MEPTLRTPARPPVPSPSPACASSGRTSSARPSSAAARPPGERGPRGVDGDLDWAGLIEHRDHLVARLSRRLRDENEVQDVVQEALLRAARYRKVPMTPGRTRSWLLRIAENVHLDRLRRGARERAGRVEEARAGRRAEPVDPDHPGRVPAGAPWELAGHCMAPDRAAHHVLRAIGRLPDHDVSVLDAWYRLEGDSRAAASELGIERSLVKVRLFRARRRLDRVLRDELARHWVGR